MSYEIKMTYSKVYEAFWTYTILCWSSPARSVHVVLQTSDHLVIGEEGHVAWMSHC